MSFTVLDVFRIATLALVLSSVSCVKVANDRYTIRGHDVARLVGKEGSRRDLSPGTTTDVEVLQKLGEPALRSGAHNRTHIYLAPVGYRWVFSPWPVALANQAGLGDAPMLLRLDYDENGVLIQSDTHRLPGGAPRRDLQQDVEAAWPDLGQILGGQIQGWGH